MTEYQQHPFLQRKRKHSPLWPPRFPNHKHTSRDRQPVWDSQRAQGYGVCAGLEWVLSRWKSVLLLKSSTFFLIKSNWFSDRIYNRLSDKPTDLHTHIQTTGAPRVQGSGFLLETMKLLNIEIIDSCRNPGTPPKQSVSKRLRVVICTVSLPR